MGVCIISSSLSLSPALIQSSFLCFGSLCVSDEFETLDSVTFDTEYGACATLTKDVHLFDCFFFFRNIANLHLSNSFCNQHTIGMDTEFDNIDPALIHHRILASQPIEANTSSQPFYFDIVRLVSILYNHSETGNTQNEFEQSQNVSNGLTNHQNIPAGSRSKPRSIYIGSTRECRFICDSPADNDSWIHRVRLAQNCFEQNLLSVAVSPPEDRLSLASPSASSGRIKIQFQSHRPIAPGEELCFWPSFDLSLQLNIPFLAPANIISGSCFLCTKCGKFFSQPNPLKIHIKFACFDVLQKSLLSNFNPALEWNGWSNTFGMNGIWSSMNVMNSQESIRQQSPSTVVKETEKLSYHFDKIARKSYENVSGKRLHHCNYCGKVYTRKYGLKIHIRTHTGLKPLSCRFCARSFSDPSNLNKHVRLHTQSKS